MTQTEALQEAQTIQLTWMDSKGGGRMRTFSTPELCWNFMQTLRTRATVRERGEVIGRIEHRSDGYQDQPGNRQWFGWIDLGKPSLAKDGWDYVPEAAFADADQKEATK